MAMELARAKGIVRANKGGAANEGGSANKVGFGIGDADRFGKSYIM
ncbi:MAG: hypothetical protein HFH76_18615 [Lachnospiraceae bacterium]|nr:hypothetical protein [Lachnospiraceae bacterium]